jgi:hypothetical protein
MSETNQIPIERYEKLLKDMEAALNEMQIPVRFLPVSEYMPIPSLLLSVTPDQKGRERVMTIAFIPDDGEIQEVDLLQFFMGLHASFQEFSPRLGPINQNAILGHAGYKAETQEYYYRHVWPIPKSSPVTPSVLVETLQLFLFSADLANKELEGED